MFKLLQSSLFITLVLFSINGCKEPVDIPEQTTAVPLPEVTTAYLFEHRIIAHMPTFGEKVISTLPYETTTFDEDYIFYLVARLPDPHSTAQTKRTSTRYYLWLERTSNGWLDFTQAYSNELGRFVIVGHNSSIRSGRFYKDYTIDLSLSQIEFVRNKGLTFHLYNNNAQSSTIFLPKEYIEAFLLALENNK
jgi:hypothetical protein